MHRPLRRREMRGDRRPRRLVETADERSYFTRQERACGATNWMRVLILIVARHGRFPRHQDQAVPGEEGQWLVLRPKQTRQAARRAWL